MKFANKSGKTVMKILIITYYYAPAISPRAFRWAAIAEYCARQGHYVDVVCSWMPGQPRAEDLNGVHVYRVGGGAVEALRRRFRKADAHPNVKRSKSRDSDSSSATQNLASFAKWLHDHTWKKVYWPDYACLWYLPALKTAKRLLAMHHYDGLISVSYPFTGHLVGLSLNRSAPQMPWIVDSGDPFCFLERTPTNNYKLYRILNYAYERKIFGRADAIAVTTEPTFEKYAELFPESATKIHVIPPLLSLETNHTIECSVFPEDQKIRLVFIGTLYRTIRNPDFLLHLFGNLLQTHLADRLELHFFGNIHDCQDCFEPYKILLDTKIFLHGVVSRDKAFQAMKEADILVNIGNDMPYQLPSKVVEYASTGKPVLNLVKTDEDSSVAFFYPYPASLSLLDNTVTLYSDQFDKLIQFIEHPPHIEAQMLQHWLATFQKESIAASYMELLY